MSVQGSGDIAAIDVQDVESHIVRGLAQLKALIDDGLDVHEEAEVRGFVPVLTCASPNHIVLVLMQDGQSLLHIAAAVGDAETVKFCLDCGLGVDCVDVVRICRCEWLRATALH